MSQSYRDLLVWQRAMDLVVEVYDVSSRFPKGEAFGLTAQLRSAVVSVPSNISEGQGRLHQGDFRHHLSIARGSLAEAETQIQIAHRLGYLSQPTLDTLWERFQDVGRLLNGFIRSLETS